MRPLDVGIIGCGTAGSAAAIFLARAGHRVTIYERVPAPQPVGAGIVLQPLGLHVLCQLDLYMHVVSRGARLDRLFCEATGNKSQRRKAIVDLAYESVGEGLFGVGLHRGVLFEALLGAAQQQKRCYVRAGVEIVDLARAENAAAREKNSRWTWLVDTEQRRHGPHELIVVADGVRSQLRDDTSTSKTIEPYPWGALWFLGRQTRKKADPMTHVFHQIAAGNQTFLGLLPTGLLPASQESSLMPSPQLVSLFWSIRSDRVTEWRKRGVEEWKREVAAVATSDKDEVEPLLEQVHDENQLIFAAYHDVVMHRWHTRNVVYIGDAAHAMSPQLGQGCNLALWDAMELSDCISSEPRDLANALDRYSRRREQHLEFYQTASRWITPFFQGDLEPLGGLRDFALPIMNKLSLFKRMMTLTMIGVMENFYGSTITLRLPSRPPESVKG